MSKAIVFKPTKNAMQSGKGKTKLWYLKFNKQSSNSVDDLMGWQGSTDMLQEVSIRFPTKEAAIEYAQNQGIDFEVVEPKERKIKIQAYADNFVN